jgi:hypothetical protein
VTIFLRLVSANLHCDDMAGCSLLISEFLFVADQRLWNSLVTIKPSYRGCTRHYAMSYSTRPRSLDAVPASRMCTPSKDGGRSRRTVGTVGRWATRGT